MILTATSGANAAGIWQIIPSTGRNYGLKQTRNYDARRDVVASTTAALNMMQRLNKMFDGDWLLTVAAYNSGEGRVMKAIKTNKARGNPRTSGRYRCRRKRSSTCLKCWH